MAETVAEQIDARFAELPETVRQAILAPETGTEIREIGRKHSLHIDQIGKLEDETMLVMLGFFEPTSFADQIKEQLNISVEDARAIAGEMEEKVFLRVRQSLKTSTVMADNAAKATHASTVTAAPIVPAVAPQVLPPTMPVVEKVLSEKTSVMPTKTADIPPTASKSDSTPKPIYKNDPYREPV